MIDPLHADTIRLIYGLALEGDGMSGPMGVGDIAAYLIQWPIFTRDGGRWDVGPVRRILARPAHVVRHEINKRAKNKTLKPNSEIVTVDVPPLIDQATFETVQEHLRVRNAKVTPAHLVSGPTHLTSICFGAGCGGATTLRAGKGGRYRCHTCAISARQGEARCNGRSIPIERLDNLVAERIVGPKAICDQAQADAQRATAAMELSAQQTITPAMVQMFARAAQERIRIDGGGYRRDDLRALARRASRSRTKRSASLDRKAICVEPLPPPRA
ncbi:MAG: recombinase family protein [Steroidobacteraceae bacterium]